MKPLRSHFHDRLGAYTQLELIPLRDKNAGQEVTILSIFTRFPHNDFTCWEIKEKMKNMGDDILLGSVRRAINHLAWKRDAKGKTIRIGGERVEYLIVKTGTVKERAGSKCAKWKLNNISTDIKNNAGDNTARCVKG